MQEKERVVMRICAQTIALLRFVHQEGGEVTVAGVASRLERRAESLRHQFDRYVENGLMTVRADVYRTGMRGRPASRYFGLTPRAVRLLKAEPHIAAAQPPRRRAVINSVFMLGAG